MGVANNNDGELDRYAPSVPGQRRHGQKITGAITRLAARHDAIEPIVMAGAKRLRDDQVKGSTDRVFSGKSKYALGARVPNSNGSIAIDSDDCVCFGRENGLREMFETHGQLSAILCVGDGGHTRFKVDKVCFG
jgi:hypothetical protein